MLGFQQRLAHDSNVPLGNSVEELTSELSEIKLEVEKYLEKMDKNGISI